MPDGDRQNADKVTPVHVLTEQDPTDAGRLGDIGGPYFARFRIAFHWQSKLVNVPSNSSPVNCPQSG
jgi:hypothetical protein